MELYLSVLCSIRIRSTWLCFKDLLWRNRAFWPMHMKQTLSTVRTKKPRIGSNRSASITISTPQTKQYLVVSEREVTIMSCGTCECYIKVAEQGSRFFGLTKFHDISMIFLGFFS